MRPSRGEKTRAEIAELVWRIIARAAYRGDKAPTMPDLAEELSVADSSVWNAVQMLCDSGLLERRKISRGDGRLRDGRGRQTFRERKAADGGVIPRRGRVGVP